MSDLPWFRFFPQDFMGDGKVQMMNATQRGIYISLLCHEWSEGPIPDEPRRLARVCGASPEAMEEAWAQVRTCFKETDDGCLVQPRLEEERDRARERVQAAQKAADARWADAGKGAESDAEADATAGADAMRSQSEGTAGGDAGRNANQNQNQNTQHMGGEQGEGDPSSVSDLPSPSEATEHGYPDAFEAAWAAYPEREGGNPKKAAYRRWLARVRDGAFPEELLAGVQRYAAFCEDEGRTATRYVKQAATFFGPDEHFREEWSTDGGGSEPDYVEGRL